MFTLTSLRSPLRSSTIRSSTGATAWHGPHHSAQKSTITGFSLWRTSSSKLCSVTAVVIGSFLTNLSVVPRVQRYESPCCPIPTICPSVRVPPPVSRSPRPRGGDPRLVGGSADLRPATRAKPRRPPLELLRRPEDGQHDRRPRRPSPLGPHVQGRFPALQGAPGLRPALPERL